MSNTNPVFGIHVGNSTACLAIYKQEDSAEVIANNAGDRVMPALVTVTDNENFVGAACKSLMITRWKTTVNCNKRMLNQESDECSTNGERKVTTILRDGELCYVFPLERGDEYMTPTEIATCIYHSLYEIARSAVPGVEGDISCVLMVPKHFSEVARFRVRIAAEAVGWDVLHIISEPAAAVVGYNMLSDKTPPPPQKVLVYRVGGRSCDANVMDLKFGMMSSLDTEHTDEIGGKLIVSSLTNYLADEFYRKYKLDPRENHRSLTKLVLAAQNCIHVLSTIESANCFVESLCEGVDFGHTVSRARFESLLFPFLDKFTRPIYTVLSRLNMTPDDVTTVVLCGGLLKIPRLKKHISEIFKESCTKVLPLPNGINYDEVLACGAAQQAGFIALNQMGDNFLPDETEIPTLEFPVTIKVDGAECDTIELERGLPTPVHKTVTLRPLGTQVTITVSQIDDIQKTVLKGEIQLKGIDNPTDISLDLDSDNGFRVGIPEESNNFTYHSVRLSEYPLI